MDDDCVDHVASSLIRVVERQWSIDSQQQQYISDSRTKEDDPPAAFSFTSARRVFLWNPTAADHNRVPHSGILHTRTFRTELSLALPCLVLGLTCALPSRLHYPLHPPFIVRLTLRQSPLSKTQPNTTATTAMDTFQKDLFKGKVLFCTGGERLRDSGPRSRTDPCRQVRDMLHYHRADDASRMLCCDCWARVGLQSLTE